MGEGKVLWLLSSLKCVTPKPGPNERRSKIRQKKNDGEKLVNNKRFYHCPPHNPTGASIQIHL